MFLLVNPGRHEHYSIALDAFLIPQFCPRSICSNCKERQHELALVFLLGLLPILQPSSFSKRPVRSRVLSRGFLSMPQVLGYDVQGPPMFNTMTQLQSRIKLVKRWELSSLHNRTNFQAGSISGHNVRKSFWQ